MPTSKPNYVVHVARVQCFFQYRPVVKPYGRGICFRVVVKDVTRDRVKGGGSYLRAKNSMSDAVC